MPGRERWGREMRTGSPPKLVDRFRNRWFTLSSATDLGRGGSQEVVSKLVQRAPS